MKNRSKVYVAVAVASSLALCACLYLVFARGPSVAALGERSTGCIVSGDSDCVFNSILARERTALDLTPEKVHKLLANYVLPAYGRLSGGPTKRQLDLAAQGQVQVAWTWPSPKAGTVMFASTAVATPDGARTICTTQWMIYHAIEAKYKQSPDELNLYVYLRGLEKDSAYLTELGIPGIYDPIMNKVVLWSDVIAKMHDNVKVMQDLKK